MAKFFVLSSLVEDNNRKPFTSFETPRIIGSFSLDKNRNRITNDQGSLRYFDPKRKEEYFPNKRSPGLDLDIGKEIWLRKYQKRELKYSKEGLKHVLKWINVNPTMTDDKEIEFVTNKHCLKAIMNAPYDTGRNRSWKVLAIKLKDKIYLNKVSQEGSYYNEPIETYRGFKFEQYMFKDTADGKPKGDKPITEAEAFYCVFKTTLEGNNKRRHHITYSAEIDGIKVSSKSKKSDAGKLPSGLSSEKLVELKTDKVRFTNNELTQIKMREWFVQGTLGRASEVICGFKSKDGRFVKSIETYTLNQLADKGWGHWKPEVCIKFLDRFLSKVKVLLDEIEAMKCVDHIGLEEIKMLICIFDPFKSEVRGEECKDLKVLPRWFLDNVVRNQEEGKE